MNQIKIFRINICVFFNDFHRFRFFNFLNRFRRLLHRICNFCCYILRRYHNWFCLFNFRSGNRLWSFYYRLLFNRFFNFYSFFFWIRNCKVLSPFNFICHNFCWSDFRINTKFFIYREVRHCCFL